MNEITSEITLSCDCCGCEIIKSTHSGFLITVRPDKNYVYCSWNCKWTHDKDFNIDPESRGFYEKWSQLIQATNQNKAI